MAGFTDFMQQKQQPAIGSGTTEPLDMGGAKQPRLTFAQYMKQKEGPQVSQQTIKDVTTKPVGQPEAPSIQPTQPQAQPMGTPQIAAEAPQQALTPETQAVDDSMSQAAMMGNPYATIGAISQQPEVREFAKTEALPVIGGLAALALAPETGGSSLLAMMGMTAGLSGAGAATGEAIEQTAKLAGVMPLGATETAPKDGWDVLERSATRGTEEAAWSVLPDVLTKGMPATWRKAIMSGGKAAVDEVGNAVDAGKLELTNLMRDYAAKHDLDTGKVLLASDVAEVPLMNMAEAISSNSYFAGSKVEAVRGLQETAIKGKIRETVGQYMNPAKGYVDSTADEAIKRYIEPNMDAMNDFAVAGLVNVGFKKAQEAQKSVARSIYKTIGDAMEMTTMKPVYKEMELPLLGADGRPMTTMVNTSQEVAAFPVDLTGVKGLAEKRAEESLTGLDRDHAEMLGLPDETDYKKAANTLTEWKATSRQLDRATTEAAPVKKMHLDRAINALESSMDDALNAAHSAGVTGPDGRSLAELKGDADNIWKEQVEDFQNSYLMNIIKKTNPKNGAPDKLGKLFMQNETAARNIIKVLDDGKSSLTGDALEQITQAENSIKGSIVQEVFMPFDKASGKYVAPDVSVINGKKEELTRIFGDEGYKELSKLSAIIEQQAGTNTSNFLGFAQRARESGMLMTTLKGLSQADFGPLIRDGGSTVLFALGMGRILTNTKNIRYAANLADRRVPEPVRIGILRNLAHQYENWQKVNADTASGEEKERGEGRDTDNKDYNETLKGIQSMPQ